MTLSACLDPQGPQYSQMALAGTGGVRNHKASGSCTWRTWGRRGPGRCEACVPPAALQSRRAALGAAWSLAPQSPAAARRACWAARRNLESESRKRQERGGRDGRARLGPPAAGRLHPHRAPGQWHVRHSVQSLRQGGCGAVHSRGRGTDEGRAPVPAGPRASPAGRPSER